MDEIRYYFKKAIDHAVINTTCTKVAVGALFVENDGKKRLFYGANNNFADGCNCRRIGECYKAKVTGIYESSEETRKYCKATHAEINLISIIRNQKKKVDTSNGILYVTRYPCINCSKKIVASGFKHVRYCGKQEISNDVKELFDKYNVKYEWYPDIDYEDSIRDRWWTWKFYDEAYEIVKDRKIPLTIPGYAKPGFDPNLQTLEVLGWDKMNDNYNYPCFIFVRESQKEIYEKATKKYKYVTIVSFPDELISNAGAVRRASCKWLYKNGYNLAFQVDDDLRSICFSFNDRLKDKDGYPKMDYLHINQLDESNKRYFTHETEIGEQTSRILAMWQIAMEKAVANFDAFVSGGMQISFCWKTEYGYSTESCVADWGGLTQCVCFNVKSIVENGLFHRDNKISGLDDIDFTINGIQKGFHTCSFPWLVYSGDPMGAPGQPFEEIQKRFTNQNKIMSKNHGDKSWVKFREKRGLDQCCIYWRGARKHLAENAVIKIPGLLENNRYDMWEDGDLLNQARTQNYTKMTP